MKKILTLFIIGTITSIGILFTEVNAATISIGFEFGNGNGTCTEVTDANGKSVQKCDMKLTISGGTYYLDNFKIDLKMYNVTFDKKNYTLNDDFYISNISSDSLIIKTKKNAFPLGTYEIGSLYFYKVNEAANCYIVTTFTPTRINRSCDNSEIKNGIYYDINGDLTDELTYQKQCTSNVCVAYSDGTYTDPYGNVVDKNTYENLCLEKNTCEIIDGKYYGNDGNEVTELDYKKQCKKNYCEILSDGTYYGLSGTVVTKDVYENECLEKYICTINNGKYYDENGKETTKLEYQKQCEKNVCTILSDGTIYDKDGNITDEETYKKQCEKHNCEIIDDTYYDKDGKVIDEKTYNLVCKTHKCEKVEDKYFDNNGNIVDEETYNKTCNVVENPQTGNILPIVSLIAALFIGGILLIISQKNKKLRN